MATVCVLGSGARELALVRALKRSSKCGAVRCFGAEPNPGIAELAGAVEVGDETSPDAVLAFCKGGKADLVIAGGTASRSGVVDVLLGGGIRVVGARKAAAAVADVDFARDLMKQVRAGPPAAHNPTHGLRPRSRAGSRHRHFALEAPPLP
jgi:phosphoribosylamine---glycine ligase